MNLIVDYDKLEDVGKEISEEEIKLENSLTNIEKILMELKDCWKGKDSEQFISNATEYIQNEKEKAKRVNILGEVVSKVAGNYRDKDYEWLDRLKEKEQE